MSERAEPSVASAWAAYRTLVGAAVLAGLVIASVFEATAPTIAANRAERLASAIAGMLPNVSTWRDYALNDDDELVPADAAHPATVRALYDSDGKLLGFAINARVMGYQDRIEAIYAYDPRAGTVVGLEVLASRETPGLGSRIATDEKFRANFTALDVSLDAAGTGLVHPIVVVQEGKRRQPWEMDAITGATVSSRAVGRLLNESAARALPAVHADLARFSTSKHDE